MLMFRLYTICFFLSSLFSLCGYGSNKVENIRMSTASAYYRGQLLGVGAVAAVYFGYEIRKPDYPLALRITRKTLGAKIVKAELEGLCLQKDLPDHPGILKLLNLTCYPDHDILSVFPLMLGGDLFGFIDKVEKGKGVLSDELACRCFRSWTKAVVFLHSQGITHRDIKPENILVGFYLVASSPSAIPFIDTPDPDSLKLSDFGIAKRFTPGQKHSASRGTPRYQAPEIHRGVYSETVDVWSATVTFFVLMMQIFPFEEKSRGFFLGQISKYTRYEERMPPQMRNFFDFVFSKHATINPDYFTAQSLMDTLDECLSVTRATFDLPHESLVPLPQLDIAIPSDRQSELLSPASAGLLAANSAKRRVSLLRSFLKAGGRESLL